MPILNPNPLECPARNACAWGEDPYGIWQAFEFNSVRQVFRWIAPGEFVMGSPEDEPERRDNEKQHTVTLSQGYWLADTACTQALWQAVMGENPSHFKDRLEHPVECISWDDCQVFVSKANDLLSGAFALRLPTEAEWEYACRAGTTTPFSFGHELTPELANYNGTVPYNKGAKGKYREQTVEVLSFAPNPWGLYQMHGNVLEWCAGCYGEYPAVSDIDPQGPAESHVRVLRGGGWLDSGRRLRAAYRDSGISDWRYGFFGVRLAGD